MIGIFGNANPLDATQWLNVDFSIPSFGSPTMYTEDAKCTDIPSSINMNIIWTYVGSIKNPQARIVNVEVTYENTEMIFTTSKSDRQGFNFMSTVTWVYQEESSSIYDPPAPPIIFSVPHDVFYPFAISS